jgi:hypothetical protein
VRYSRSVTGTPADFSSWKKVTNIDDPCRGRFGMLRARSVPSNPRLR